MACLPLTLFGVAPFTVDQQRRPERIQLDPCCWVDRIEGFVHGADALLYELIDSLLWQQGRRVMFGNWYDEPRLTATTSRPDTTTPGAVGEIRSRLNELYGRSFEGLMCNYYRDGSDSVGWHADRVGHTEVEPLVAIVSLGGPRTFAMRSQAEALSERFVLQSGDLLVMGGGTQHHWQHGIAKTSAAAPRISVTMRAGNQAERDGQLGGSLIEYRDLGV